MLRGVLFVARTTFSLNFGGPFLEGGCFYNVRRQMLCYFRDNTSSSGGIFLMMPYMLAPREWLVAKNQETEEAVGYPKGHPDS